MPNMHRTSRQQPDPLSAPDPSKKAKYAFGRASAKSLLVYKRI